MRDFIITICLTLVLAAMFSFCIGFTPQEQADSSNPSDSHFSVPFGEPVQQLTEGTGGNLPVPQPPAQQDDIEELAWEVIKGIWDNGEKRKQLLTEAGHNYKAVQQRVNEILGWTEYTQQ